MNSMISVTAGEDRVLKMKADYQTKAMKKVSFFLDSERQNSHALDNDYKSDNESLYRNEGTIDEDNIELGLFGENDESNANGNNNNDSNDQTTKGTTKSAGNDDVGDV
eukprot:CAMPEP_0114668168 /NCGR_PEP_ID=MMETSP0191-20121206/35797_1 /TAXON_ID=126664 /ORGANISM="Sorites sp." /LENGTH=107 /DNA_ID=CAMNT_0001920559 /DNA_START=31 /DNA_END=354 /DNA_ORIENTATION=-